MKYSVAIIAIARLENPYINEWISYHRKLGVEHFYIYDNSFGNEERIDRVITQENSFATTIIPVYNMYNQQGIVYEQAYNNFGYKHDYMLVIDIDEFFTLNKHNTIQDYISFLNYHCPGFEQARIQWELYGDNDVIERDISIPVTKFFTKLSKLQLKQAKSLIKCRIGGMYFPSSHYSKSKSEDLIICDSCGRRINPNGVSLDIYDVSVAKIRHYITKTLQEYMMQKLCRDDACGYMVRTVDNKFFPYCNRTYEKEKYYEEHKHLIKIEKSQ